MDTFSAQFNTSGGQKLRNPRPKYQVFHKTCRDSPRNAFQVELDEPYRFHYFLFTPNILLVLNIRFSIKPVAILPEMLSNSLIHFPSRTRRALSIPLLSFYTKHPHLPKISKNYKKKGPSKIHQIL